MSSFAAWARPSAIATFDGTHSRVSPHTATPAQPTLGARPTLLAGAIAVAVIITVTIGLGASDLSFDKGASGVWQRLLKLRTTASAMHTTAHPDDEHGGVLTWLSRGQGVRVSLLTLNRGEAGDNAIGAELFDPLGLIRTEELLAADRYYGVDQQYFTTVVDYGFSKRLEEALEKWGREYVLGEMVRVIRIERPLVLVSRFQGNERDGHGNHQTAGLMTVDAFKAAGDPSKFPDQIAAGLRAWQPLKVYVGGMRENEDWQVRVDVGEYSPWLGDSYVNVANIGLSFQRSQNSGRRSIQTGPSYAYYKRVATVVEAKVKEDGFFDGIDTTLPGLFAAVRRTEPTGALPPLIAIDREVKTAVAAFSMTNPAAVVPALARGLAATRAAIARFADEPDAVHVLRIKERQFADAINTALGLDLAAMAQPAGIADPTGPFAAFAPPPTMGAVVPGQTFEIRTTLTNRSQLDITSPSIVIQADPGWAVTPMPGRDGQGQAPVLGYNDVARERFAVTLGADVQPSRNVFGRASIRDARYTVANEAHRHTPAPPAGATAVAGYTVAGVHVEMSVPVRRREPNLPFGYELRDLTVVPALNVRLSPEAAVVPLAADRKTVEFRVDVENNTNGPLAGDVTLGLPRDWRSMPASQPFSFSRPGEERVFRFEVDVSPITSRGGRVEAIARVGAREFTEGYQVVAHRDLETRYLYRLADALVRGVDVLVPSRLTVGYVMGVGDRVPEGLAQLGATVTLLGERDLATGDLSTFDAIVTGTRAYVVRDDLRTHNQRLLDYVKEGGNLIVLYNTPEYVPSQFAPYPATLPSDAEEVSEEDAPVEILTPEDRVFTWPNKITAADFDGWVEQRGSKFWSTWDRAYTPLVSSHDRGQTPQRGGWLHAPYGKGHFTYFAYAFHRQLPYAVPGAYRLLANLLSLNKSPR
ncbi:MAG: PIG-L family deacetylase [Vicinamibacterales bacterium]